MRYRCELLAVRHRAQFALAVWLCAILGGGSAVLMTSGAALAADETTAQAAGEAKAPPAESPPNPLQFKTDLALWTFVVFVVLFMVLKKFAWGPIAASLDRREQNIAKNIEASRQAHEEAKSLLAEYERKLAGAADQVREMLEEARRDGENVKQEILAEAKAAAQAEHGRAMRDIRTATDAAVEELSKRSADLAVELAGKVISAKLTSDERSKLVQDSLTKFAAAAPSAN